MNDSMNRDWPVGSWIPHEPDTWPFRFAIVKQPTRLLEWVDRKRDPITYEPIMVERRIPAGTKVKIVMVSRLGDVGITDDLTAKTGYLARVFLSDLKPAT